MMGGWLMALALSAGTADVNSGADSASVASAPRDDRSAQVTRLPPDHRGLSIRVSHGFDRGRARERIGQLVDYWVQRFGIKSEWRDYRVAMAGRILGVDFDATFEVLDSEVRATSTDPGVFWRGAANRYVEKKLRKYLSPTYAEP